MCEVCYIKRLMKKLGRMCDEFGLKEERPDVELEKKKGRPDQG